VPSKSNTRMGNSDRARSGRQRVKTYQEEIGLLAVRALSAAKREGTGPFPLTGARRVKLFGFAQTTDADNWWKATLDGLEHVCYHNDSQVIEGYWRVLPPEEARGRHGLCVIVQWLD
jgi:Holliday junction resolvase RusA-like endonuclease